jgi:hypothetical protein
MADPHCVEKCLPMLYECDSIFGSPTVLPAPRGGTLVQWELNPIVRDYGNYIYTLQTGDADAREDAAWHNVASGENVAYLIDESRWSPSVYNCKYYRLKLETSERIYYSSPLNTYGKLSYSDWRLYVSVLRAEEIQLRCRTGIDGVIFKRKVSGQPCKRCVDYNTGEVTDGGCNVCYGTGWVSGYYNPVKCCWFGVEPTNLTVQHDVEAQGVVRADTSYKARVIAAPILATQDIWCNVQSGERFKIVQLQNIVEVKGVPVVHQIAMDKLPVSDVAYSLVIG